MKHIQKEDFILTRNMIKEIELKGMETDFSFKVDMDNIADIKEATKQVYELLPFSTLRDFEDYMHISTVYEISFFDIQDLLNSNGRISDLIDINHYFIQYAQNQPNANMDKITFYLEFYAILEYYKKVASSTFDSKTNERMLEEYRILYTMFDKTSRTDYDIVKVIESISKKSKFIGHMLNNSIHYY